MDCNEFRKNFAISFKRTCLLIFSFGVVCAQRGSIGCAQDSERKSSAPHSSLRFELEPNSRLGGHLNLSGQWGELHLRLENSGNVPRDLLCTTYFDDHSSLQFGRQVWIPARSRLSISHPVKFPEADQIHGQSANAVSLVLEQSGGTEVLLRNASGQLRHERPLLVPRTERNTGIVASWNESEAVPQDVVDVVVASRVHQGLTNKITLLPDHFLPSNETSLRSLDHLVLTENRLFEDEAASSAVRCWLHKGGRLWIMMDRVDPKVLELLLGDDFHARVIDHIGLTTVRVDTAPTLGSPDGRLGKPAEFDEPVEMTRLVVTGMKVWNTVDGWPAAITQSVGEGRLLITTLGARGWIKPTPQLVRAERPIAPEMQSPYAPISEMEDLAAYILAGRDEEMLSESAMESFAQEYVSYQIPSWSLMAATMTGFLLALLAVAFFLLKKELVEHFSWASSLLALGFGLALGGIGVSNSFGVPGTEASVQVAQAISGTDDVRAHGVIAVYRPETENSRIQTISGSALWPDMSGMESVQRRMITTDLGTSHWDGLPQPVGFRRFTLDSLASHSPRIEANITLDSNGIAGRYFGPPTTGAEVVLATRFGRLGASLSRDGVLHASADDVFEEGQYLAATFLGDEQDRRRRLLEQLFESRTWLECLDAPQLLVWVNELNHGLQLGDGLSHRGDTLLAVPLKISRPPSGAEIVIPSLLLNFAQRRPPDGSLSPAFWDDKRKEWQERSGQSTTWLSFQIPRELLPLAATKARLDVRMSGPMGRLEILGVKQNVATSLQTVSSPAGSVTFDIDDSEVLALSGNGEIALGISAGLPSAAVAISNSANWKIESLALQIWARVTEAQGNE